MHDHILAQLQCLQLVKNLDQNLKIQKKFVVGFSMICSTEIINQRR